MTILFQFCDNALPEEPAMLKTGLAAVAAAFFLAGAAHAGDFGPAPANYETAAQDYVSERLADPRSAQFQILGEPYQVFADLKGHERLACWAVDIRVRSRLPDGRIGGFVPQTVLFYEGRPVALRDDARRVARLAGPEAIHLSQNRQ
jgi:hypothetical protein